MGDGTVGGFDIPRRGTITGRAKLRGTQKLMNVDAQVAFNDAQGTGRSEMAAIGQIGYEDRGRTGILRARNLRVRLLPLRLELAQAFAPGLTVGGKAFKEKELLKQFTSTTPGWLTWYTKNDQYSKQKLTADLEKILVASQTEFPDGEHVQVKSHPQPDSHRG